MGPIWISANSYGANTEGGAGPDALNVHYPICRQGGSIYRIRRPLAMTSKRIGSTLRQIPLGIWMLGFVSMLMDISSEMVHSLLPMFMVGGLGASALTVGIVEGLAESTALIVKVFSGTLSDYLGKRKGLALFGYALGALTKPLFAVANTTGMVLTARMLDRVGKGVRGAPRGDAWSPPRSCRSQPASSCSTRRCRTLWRPFRYSKTIDGIGLGHGPGGAPCP